MAQVWRAFSREDRRQDGSLKYKQIAIRRKGVFFFAVSSGDKMRSKGFKRQKVRLRPVIKGFFVPVSPGRDRLGKKSPSGDSWRKGQTVRTSDVCSPFQPCFPSEIHSLYTCGAPFPLWRQLQGSCSDERSLLPLVLGGSAQPCWVLQEACHLPVMANWKGRKSSCSCWMAATSRTRFCE